MNDGPWMMPPGPVDAHHQRLEPDRRYRMEPLKLGGLLPPARQRITVAAMLEFQRKARWLRKNVRSKYNPAACSGTGAAARRLRALERRSRHALVSSTRETDAPEP